jgi:hypothetical protein
LQKLRTARVTKQHTVLYDSTTTLNTAYVRLRDHTPGPALREQYEILRGYAEQENANSLDLTSVLLGQPAETAAEEDDLGVTAITTELDRISGVVSYAVSQRRREIGIRLALGARPGELQQMFVRHALALAGIGMVIGLGAAMALTRLMASQLFGVSPLDPPTYVAVAAVLTIAAALASYLPARRASVVNPVEVLKAE